MELLEKELEPLPYPLELQVYINTLLVVVAAVFMLLSTSAVMAEAMAEMVYMIMTPKQALAVYVAVVKVQLMVAA